MQSSISFKKPEKEKTYPYIGYYSPESPILIVLFSERKKGVCLYCSNKEHEIGVTRNDWSEDQYKLFEGSIALSN